MPRPKRNSKIGKLNQAKGAQKHREYMEDKRLARGFIKSYFEWQVLRDFMAEKSPATFCQHLRIGSSQFQRLVKGTLHPTQVHQSAYYYGAHSDGAKYEAEFASYSGIISEDNETIDFGEKWGQEFDVSSKFPFLTAKPDFRTSFKSAMSDPEGCLVEVKSTATEAVRTAAMESDDNDATAQLLCSLDIFNIKHGFLVYYLKTDKEDVFDFDVKHVEAEDFLSNQKEAIIEGYTTYLIKLVGAYAGEEEGAELLRDDIRAFVIDYCANYKKPPISPTGGHPVVSKKCAYGRTLPAFINKNRAKVGRPKKTEIHKATGRKWVERELRLRNIS